MTEIRCSHCGAKLAEFVEGRAVIVCRRCKTVNILRGVQSVKADAVVQ